MRIPIAPLFAALVAAGATAGVAAADRGPEGHHDARYSIGLWGDLPYNDVQKTVGVPNRHAVLARPPSAAPRGPGEAVRREPALGARPRRLRDAQRPGVVQQPV